MELKYFGEIDTTDPEGYYEATAPYKGQEIDLLIDFMGEIPPKKALKRLQKGLEKLGKILDQSYKWILKDFKKGVDVQDYLHFQLEELTADDLAAVLAGTDASLPNATRFLQAMKVDSLTFYPNDAVDFVGVDWMIDSDISNYVLAVGLDWRFRLVGIEVES